MRSQGTDEASAVITNAVMYSANVDSYVFCQNMYGMEYEGYAKEKWDHMQRNFVGYWGSLDFGNRARFVKLSQAFAIRTQ